ncbi:MAG: hypothetical protein LBC20_10195 [Planctomycetaceae bacterium]|jgi:hypothetical protein|nr:hypothetical protein [Planctomycetaceae bacterium]
MPDQFNPIFVFEIRQVVRNRLILGALCFYLLLLIALVGYELISAQQNGLLTEEHLHFGAKLTGSILRLLNSFSLGVLLIHTIITTTDQGLHQEILFQTLIDSHTTGFGKTWSAILLTLLFYFVTLPFLAIAWMLRGVDIVILGCTLSELFLLTQVINIYVTAAFLRCSDTNHLLTAILGLVVAFPPLGGIWFGTDRFLLFFEYFEGVGIPLYTLFAVIVFTFFMFMNVTEMFRMNWQLAPPNRRFWVNACFPWFGFVLAIGLSLSIVVPVSMIITMIITMIFQFM